MLTLSGNTNSTTTTISRTAWTRVSHHHSMTSQVEVQTQIGLWSDPVERTPMCSQTEITGSGRKLKALQSGRWSGFGLIRGQFGLIITSSSARGSDQKCFRTQLGLIRDNFEGLLFFFFLFFFTERCWLCQEATIKQRSDQRPIWSPIALIRKKDSSW